MEIKQVCLDSDPNHMGTQNVMCCASASNDVDSKNTNKKKKNLIEMINKLKTVNYH